MHAQTKPYFCAILALCLAFCAGCSNPVYTTFDQNYIGHGFPGNAFQSDGFPLDRVGVCGPMADDVTDIFIYSGYVAANLGPDCSAGLDKADALGIKIVAGIERAPDPDKLPGVADDYNMVVLDLRTGDPIWRVDGEEAPGGIRVRRNQTLDMAFRDMVRALSTIYPPAKRQAASQN